LIKQKHKKGQETGSQAAILILIITLLFIFYILFLPPEDRCELLGGSVCDGITSGGDNIYNPKDSSSSSTITKGTVLESITPPTLDYRSLDSYEYSLPSFSLFSQEESKVYKQASDFFVRKSWFDDVTKEIDFTINNQENIQNLYLSANLEKDHQGNLIIHVNEYEIYNNKPTDVNIGPIFIRQNQINNGLNTLKFSTTQVGLKFWTSNLYKISSIMLTGNELDTTNTESLMTFYISPEQGEDIEKVTLEFYPDCQGSTNSLLYISLNDVQIYKAVPDCGILNSYTISPNKLYIGSNKINFQSTDGRYLITNIAVKTQLKEPNYPTYYFDLKQDLFYQKKLEYKTCGQIDGHCPIDCSEDVDKDCCFEKYTNAYWCDTKTNLLDDRCVGYVDSSSCDRCPSGYKDENNKPSNACEGLCGDDTDNKCPIGCSTNHDKDCCFIQDGEQYWCKDLPISGIDFRCVDEISSSSCTLCQTGYIGEKTNPKCDFNQGTDGEQEDELKPTYKINLEFKFSEKGNEKRAVLYLNGRETRFETRDNIYTLNINHYVESGTNSLKIIPKSNLEIRQINIKLD
jgi:hypothetical protein